MKKIILLLFSLLLNSILLAGIYSGGSGTSLDPYQIETPDDLIELSNTSGDWDKYFIQTADITWDSGENWGLIGSYTDYSNNEPFTGVYNGGGNTITGLNINLPSTNGVAFIAYTDGAEIRNLGLVNVSIVGNEQVSALVGRTNNSTMISNCFSTGAISSGSYYGMVGGLIGYHAGSSSIENSYSMASITGTRPGGTRSLGGLIGSTHISSVTNCYSTGAVSGGTEYVGGLIGYSMATVSNSFWDTESSGQATSAAGTGKTTAEMQEASLFIQSGWDFMDESENGTNDFWGMNSTDNSGYPFLSWQSYTNEPELLLSTQHVTNISTSTLTATANGTIYSLGDPAPTQHGVCWNTTGNPTLADNYTEEGAPTAGSFTTEISGLSLHEVYYVRAYATNSNETVYGDEVSFAMISAVAPAVGDGSEATPYEIANLENLLWLSENNSEWNKYFIQTADIDASATQHINQGSGFSPIGNSSVKFTGNYHGQYHRIDGLFINRPASDEIGLFGYVASSGTIKKLGVINANVTGSSCTGSLVGQLYSSYSLIENCYSTGTVTGLSYTGGLIGWLAYGTMNNCYGDMEVLGASYTGSLVGRIQGGEVNNCYSHGSAAKNPNTSSMTSVGGFAGAVDNSSTVNHCFSTASVGNGNNRGGFVAYFSNASVTNCFWDTQSSGMTISAAGTGKTTAELLDYSTYTDLTTAGLTSAWDFVDYPNDDAADNDYWGINPGENNGYPFLTWQGYDYLCGPTVLTEAVTDIDMESATATGNGNISSLGSSNPTHYGVCWNTSGNPTTEDNTTDEGATSTTGTFTSNIAGLNECTTYFVRAYATNSYSVNYGEVVSFTTSDVTAPVPDVAELEDVTAECEVTELTAPTATDNCSGMVTGTHDAALPINTQGTTVVTWTYDDGNGNVATQTQNVVINDVSAPV
ncbi:MAG: GLUG motif-containing protein, partial [Bacteroidales bacterium]|nr:GLUG motif-containing protein [Bacteroidales bacterium]